MKDQSSKRIPHDYKAASWRGTTPVDEPAGEIGIAFDLTYGTVRLRLDCENARRLAESMNSYLGRCHSTASGGVPSADVSTPDEGLNV